ncbi:MAG: cytidine deaminase [Deltaproteobacteria bacterium]|nr:cytidine deaminase [Deltaproteobacteria bacterium]
MICPRRLLMMTGVHLPLGADLDYLVLMSVRKRAQRARRLRSEVVIGLAAGVGAPLELVQSRIASALEKLGYEVELIHLSGLTELFDLSTPSPGSSAGEAERIDAGMRRGNEAREATGHDDILAMAAVGQIRNRRGRGLTRLDGRAFVLRQLKHPAEVDLLRRVYRDGFHLVGVYSPVEAREERLADHGMHEDRIAELIARDEREPSTSGQRLRDTFHLADVFVNVAKSRSAIASQIERYFALVYGKGLHGPTPDEFGMFQAYASALRSVQLGRQVGAAILSPHRDLIAVGTNEVPRAGGGPYFDGDPEDARDHIRGRDSSDEMRERMATEIASRVIDGWESLSPAGRLERARGIQERLESTTISALTEFGRAVHAEADALLSAARVGVSTRGCSLYATTFPCHVCAKHIVSAAIDRVVFIEPYPKSRARELFDDSISLEKRSKSRVLFEPFVGVAPRRYVELFSMRAPDGEEIARKDAAGFVLGEFRRPRLEMSYSSAIDREGWAADELRGLLGEGEGS